MMQSQWDRDIRVRVIALIENGNYTASQAGEMCGVPKVTARRWWRQYQESGVIGRKGGSGRPRVSNAAQDQRLFENIRANPFLSCRQLREISQYPGSGRTVARRLKDIGLYSRRAAIKQPLTDYQKIDRMAFAAEFSDFDWSRVIFSDEKIFSSFSDAPVQVSHKSYFINIEKLRNSSEEARNH